MIRMKSGSTLIGGKLFDARDGAFEAPAEIEERLVNIGVAVKVAETPAETVKDTGSVEVPQTEENGTEAVCEDESYKDASVADLRKIAKERGIKFRVGMTKAEMIDALNDGPVFTAAEPIG